MRHRPASGTWIYVLLALLVATLAWSQVHAHESWINNSGYKAPTGEHCCGNNDCFALALDDVSFLPGPSGGAWLIRSLGETVPDSEAQISEDGAFWRCKRSDGSRRCFFKPRFGS